MPNINYQPKDYNTIFEDYIRKAAANGLIYGDEGQIQEILHGENIENILIMELAIHSEILTETYKELTNIHNSYDLNKATGENLDRLLEPFISRLNSTHAIAEICLQKDKNSTQEVTIPLGTFITSTQYPEITFETMEDITIPAETEKVIIDARCTNPGPEGNIPSNKLNKLITPIAGIIEVTNPTAAMGGRNREDDNSYRLRGQAWTSINTQGTLMAFENAIKSVASVEDYYIQQRWDGPGTTRIIINPPQQKVLEDVNHALMDVCAVDEEYTVIGAENKEININVNITINTSEGNLIGTLQKQQTISQIENALKTYIEGDYNPSKGKIGGLRLGEDFIPSRAAAHLIHTLDTVKDVHITHPTTLINIDYYQKAVPGEIHIEIQ
jgi:uncharacterized phage protein gp47/JayE